MNICLFNRFLGIICLIFAISVLFSGFTHADDGFDPFGGAGQTENVIIEKNAGKEDGPAIPEIQFQNNDISMAFQIVSDVSGWSIFPTSEVSKAKITLWAKNLSARELLDKVIAMSGFIYHQEGNVISVMTYDEYLQNYGLVKKIIPIEYASAISVSEVIKTFLSKLGKIVVHEGTNTIVLYESEANLEYIVGIAQQLDKPGDKKIVEVIELKFTDSESVTAILQGIFTSNESQNLNKSKAGTKAPGGTSNKADLQEKTKDIFISGEQVGVFAVPDSNRVVIVGNQRDIDEVKKLVLQIDVDSESSTLEIVELEYADAEFLAGTLREIFSVDRRNSTRSSVNTADRNRGTGTGNLTVEGSESLDFFAVGRTNRLIIKGLKRDIGRVLKFVEKLDIFTDSTTKSYYIAYLDAADVLDSLEKVLGVYSGGGGYSNQYGQNSMNQNQYMGRQRFGKQSSVSLTLLEDNNSILLTGPPSTHRIAESILESIDVQSEYEAGIIKIYKLENAEIEEVASVIKELLEEDEEDVSSNESKFSSKEANNENSVSVDGKAKLDEYSRKIKTRVTTNKSTNSVIIQATASRHRELERLIKELDARKDQVMIEAKIIEVITSDDLDFGVEINNVSDDIISFSSFGLSKLDPATGLREVMVAPGGTAALLRPDKVQAILHAVKSNNNMRIKSAPKILVNDNSTGVISSLSQEPTKVTNQGETTTTTSFGGYETAGTQFGITPHISDDNHLRVEYQISLESFDEKADPDLPPSKNSNTIQSQATVPDGATIVVGGLQMVREVEGVDKVPFLGDIPILGWAFKNTIVRKQYRTTYLFITPKIIKNDNFDDLKKESMKDLNKLQNANKVSPEKDLISCLESDF